MVSSVCVLFLVVVFSSLRQGLFADGTEEFVEDYHNCLNGCTCDYADDKMECIGLHMNGYPINIMPNVRILDFSRNEFDFIPWMLLAYQQLESLRLRSNKITKLDKMDNYYPKSKLQYLDLSYNYITTVDPLSINASNTLKTLDLTCNKINIQDGIFLYSVSLESLSLKNCSLDYISKDFLTGLTSLKYLTLSDNNFLTLPNLHSVTLRELDLSGNNIQFIIANTTATLPSLERMNLSRNRNLRSLTLHHCCLKYIDASDCDLGRFNLSNMNSLKEANLSSNQIRDIFNSNLINPQLTHLYLSENTLRAIDRLAMSKLRSLEILDLSSNTITTVDRIAFANNKLHSLNLSRNYLSEVPSLKSNTLQLLDMSACEVQKLEEVDLGLMPRLQSLVLSNNLIRDLPEHLFSKTLSKLWLNSCKISEVKNTTFLGLPKLRLLDLSDNKLTSGLKPEFFPETLRGIDLYDNLWRCDCFNTDFRRLYDYLTKPPTQSIANPNRLLCHSPENVTGRSWHVACQNYWYMYDYERAGNRAWVYFGALVVAIFLGFSVCIGIRRAYKAKQLREQRERERAAAEARERLRRMRQQQLQQQQQARQNAPDPRELSRPPSYDEAVRMAQMDGSCGNLAQAGQSSRRKRTSSSEARPRSETRTPASEEHPRSETRSPASEARPRSETRAPASEAHPRSETRTPDNTKPVGNNEGESPKLLPSERENNSGSSDCEEQRNMIRSRNITESDL